MGIDTTLRNTRMTRPFLISLAVTIAVMSATALPLCGTMFRCGCSLAHGSSACSMHHVMGPHCPWCVKRGTAFGASFAFVLPAAVGSVLVAARRRRSVLAASSAGIITYLALAALCGFITAKIMHYPTWFGWPVGA
jgi:hypothetical protein